MATCEKREQAPPPVQYVLTLSAEEAELVAAALGQFNSSTAESRAVAAMYQSLSAEGVYGLRLRAFADEYGAFVMERKK